MTTQLQLDDAPRYARPVRPPVANVSRAYWKVPWIAMREWCTPGGRLRLPEPMVMDHPESAAEFHDGAMLSPGMRVTYDLSARCLSALLPEGGRLLDLGCGSGQALAYLSVRRPDITITGVDLAYHMLDKAHQLAAAVNISDRVDLVNADITNLPEQITSVPWDAVSCVWTLHHLPDTTVLQAALRQIAALRRAFGSAIWILDFQRLKHSDSFAAAIRALEPAVQGRLKLDATASEAAAFTFHEIQEMLTGVGLPALSGGCPLPVPWLQAHWQPAERRSPEPSCSWQEAPGGNPTRLDATLLRYGFRGLPI